MRACDRFHARAFEPGPPDHTTCTRPSLTTIESSASRPTNHRIPNAIVGGIGLEDLASANGSSSVTSNALGLATVRSNNGRRSGPTMPVLPASRSCRPQIHQRGVPRVRGDRRQNRLNQAIFCTAGGHSGHAGHASHGKHSKVRFSLMIN
jgi:hypothetical protein